MNLLSNMSARLDQWNKQEVRAVIRFLNAKNLSAAEIHRQLVDVYGEDVMTRQSVAKWCVHFRAGRVIMEDSERRGRPTTANTANNRTLVEKAIRSNSRITVRELHQDLNLSHGTVIKIIRELGFHKVCAEWVPRN